jgi:hypothetical protein
MQYLITGNLARKEVLGMAHADFVKVVQSAVAPTLSMLAEANPDRKVLAGGLPAGSRDVVMIVDLRSEGSHHCVREFLMSLPIFEYFDWHATPLETFEEILASQ